MKLNKKQLKTIIREIVEELPSGPRGEPRMRLHPTADEPDSEDEQSLLDALNQERSDRAEGSE